MERQVLAKTEPDRKLWTKSSGTASPPRPSLQSPTRLQRQLGNQAMGHILQAKLKVNEPGDEYEQEADRIADQVMRMPEPNPPIFSHGTGPQIQRKCAACASGQGLCPKCAEEETTVQRKSVDADLSSGEAPPLVHDVLNSPGEPLDPARRGFFESRFGHDFSEVRVHTGSKAAESARSVNALAYTVGRDIVFATGQYQPSTSAGRRLLAHELTHVVQQSQGRVQAAARTNRVAINDNDAREREAGGSGRGDLRSAAAAPAIVQRQPADVIQRDTASPAPEQSGSNMLDAVLPIGSGYRFEADLGVTPVLPVFVSEGQFVEVQRLTADSILVLYRRQGIAALDTGVGAGVHVGSKKRGQGIGATAGANAQAGIKVVTHQEFVVPLNRIGAFVLQMLRDNPTGGPTASHAMGLAIKAMGGAQLEGFETRLLVSFGAFAQASADAKLGVTGHNSDREGKEKPLRKDDKDKFRDVITWGSRGERTNPNKPVDDQWSPLGLTQRLLSLSAGIQAKVEANVIMNQTRLDYPGGGAEHEITLSVEGAGGVDLQLPIMAALPVPTNLGGGVTLKLKIVTNPAGKVLSHSEDWELYVKTGELDIHTGAATQSTFRFNALQVGTVEELINLLTPGKVGSVANLATALLQKVEVRQRYNLMVDIGSRFTAFMRNRTRTRTLITDTSSWHRATAGASVGAYLTLTYGVDKDTVAKLLEILKPAGADAARRVSEAEGVLGVYEVLRQFANEFSDSPHYQKLEVVLLDSVCVSEAKLRFVYEEGIGAQAQVSKGAKLRLDAFLKAGAFCETDVAKHKITVRNFLSVAADVLAEPRKYMPDCPLIQWLLDNLNGGLLLYQLPAEKNGVGMIKGDTPGKGANRPQAAGQGPSPQPGGSGGVRAVVEVQPQEKSVAVQPTRNFPITAVRFGGDKGFEGKVVHEVSGTTYVAWVPLELTEDRGDKLALRIRIEKPLQITPDGVSPSVYLTPNMSASVTARKQAVQGMAGRQTPGP